MPSGDREGEYVVYPTAELMDIPEVPVPKTLVDIDDSLLRAVSAILGTSTKKDTVNEALREVVAMQARRHDLDWLRKGPAKQIADPGKREAAWRK
jgi:Arc/MetJ family transcription regulator